MNMSWEGELDALAQSVGFVRAETMPTPTEATRPDEPLCLWVSPYAALLVWGPLGGMNGGEERWHMVQDWFDAVLLDREKDQKGTFDGFLVVILSAQPAASESTLLSMIEADTAVCRKQVLWPGRNGNKDLEAQVKELTPLGLPDAGRAVEVAQLPELSEEQRAFVEMIGQKKSGGRMADDELREMGWPLGEDNDEAE